MITEVKGDLIYLAKQGIFNVIAHGCNCFCTMKRGLAPQMAEAFGCNSFPLEGKQFEGDINKLGQVDYSLCRGIGDDHSVIVVNCYSQYHWDTNTKPLDYEALTLCLRKINNMFKGMHIGLPQIGCHLAGGDWTIVKGIIEKELKDCKVTIVIYESNKTT